MTSRSFTRTGHRVSHEKNRGEREKQTRQSPSRPKPGKKEGLQAHFAGDFAMPQRLDLRNTAYRFEWDENKNRQNISKHGLDFADAEQMFAGIFLFRPDTRKEYGEHRSIGIGTIRGRTAVVVFTERGEGLIRIISLRKATRSERKQYEEAIQDELQAG
jgi:uncharacterized DUF497 family protein